MPNDTSDSLEKSDQPDPHSPEYKTGQKRERVSKELEIGGRDGPDPTRYGDWEKAGRCIDF